MGGTNSLLLTISFLFMVALCEEKYILKRLLSLKPMTNFIAARQLCRHEYVDMVTFDLFERAKLTSKMLDNRMSFAWVGEYREQSTPSAWKTIIMREDDDEIWRPRHPDDETCAVLVRSTGKLAGVQCSRSLPFYCVTDNLVLVKQNKTWEDARQHCEELVTPCEAGGLCKHGLLTLPEQRDLNYVRGRLYNAQTDEVWTGLRFLGSHWFWMDGAMLEDDEGLPRCPSDQRRCGTISKSNNDTWITRDCSEKRNFICARTEL